MRVGNGGRALVRVGEGGVPAVFLPGGAAKTQLPQQPTPTAQQRNTRYIQHATYMHGTFEWQFGMDITYGNWVMGIGYGNLACKSCI